MKSFISEDDIEQNLSVSGSRYQNSDGNALRVTQTKRTGVG